MLLNTFRLKVFVQVAELRSFSRAADHLYLTQPAVSTHIKALEDSLGVPLFERKVPLALTAAGTALLQSAIRLIAAIEEAEADVRSLGGALAGRLAVGISLSWRTELTHLVVQFVQAYPKVSTSVKFGYLSEFTQWLLTDELGLAFSARPIQDQRLEARTLLTVARPIFVVFPVGHPLSETPEISREMLETLPFVYFSPRIGAPLLESIGARVSYRLEIDSAEGLMAAVAAGLGVSVTTNPGPQGLPSTVQTRPLAVPPWEQQLVAVRARHRPPSKVEDAFVDYVTAVMLSPNVGPSAPSSRPSNVG